MKKWYFQIFVRLKLFAVLFLKFIDRVIIYHQVILISPLFNVTFYSPLLQQNIYYGEHKMHFVLLPAVNTLVKSSTITGVSTTKHPPAPTSTSSSTKATATAPKNSAISSTTNVKVTTNRVSFRDRLKMHTGVAKDHYSSSSSSTTISAPHPITNPSLHNSETFPSSGELQTIDSVSSSDTNDESKGGSIEAPWTKLKKAAIVNEGTASVDLPGDETKVVDVVKPPLKPKPNLVLTKKTKHYR